MKSHTVWWPHLDSARIFNPFVPVTEHRSTNDHVEFPEAGESADAEAPAEAPLQPEDRDEK